MDSLESLKMKEIIFWLPLPKGEESSATAVFLQEKCNEMIIQQGYLLSKLPN